MSDILKSFFQFDLLNTSILTAEPDVAFGPIVSPAFNITGDDLHIISDSQNVGSIPILPSNTAPPAVFELSSLLAANGGDGSAGFVINGIDNVDESGIAVSNAGDVNGDGFDDIIIGAFRADPNGNNSAGESYVVFGSNAGFAASLNLSTLNGTNGFIIEGDVAGANVGTSVSGGGDINGDGFDDLIIGAALASPNVGSQNDGESYVVFGSDAGFPSSLGLSTLNGTNGFAIPGIDGVDFSGRAVSNAGDINGDGFDDILIGAVYGDPNTNNGAGESYVVFGSNAGFAASLNLSTLNGVDGFIINGIDANDFSGGSVSGAGDINGDGFDDIIIGARGADPNGNSGAGESYVIFGRDDSVSAFAASLDLSALTGSNGFVINGVDASDFSGISVSGAGDINGDGFDDIIIGAPGADLNSNSSSGASYVIFGRDTSFAASLDLSSLNGTNGFVINGIDADDDSGVSVSGAGDVNGDGFGDLIIGASGANAGTGESYLIFGTNAGFGASLELSTLNGTNGFVITGVDMSDASGRSVSGAGDVNGDGFDDLIIGAPFGDPNGNFGAGESYIIFGSADFGMGTPDGPTPGDDDLVGTPGDDTINLLAGDDIYRGRDGDDSILGGAGNDMLFGQGGNDDISGGDGNDTVLGGLGDDMINGDTGDDFLNGQSGDDVLNGGAGVDNILGASGNDTINGGADNDTVNGNGGNDTIDGAAGDDILNGAIGFDTINGRTGNDTISGGNQNDTLNGNAGNDTINGDAGNDIVDGGANDDTINGASGADTLNGGGGNDILSGDSGGDDLFGGTGNDVLNGGGGNDDLNGGGGADIFVANLGFRTDRVQDFENGIDAIDFSGNSLANNFAQVLAAASQVGANVRIDLNANNALILENFNLADLDASDFIF